MTDVPVRVYYTIAGTFPADPGSYESLTEFTPEAVAQFETLQYETGAFPVAELVEFDDGEPTVRITAEPQVVAPFSVVLGILQQICDVQSHNVPVMACMKVLCVANTVALFGEPEED